MTDTPAKSRLVKYLGRLSLACLLAIPLSVLAVRIGLHFGVGLPIFALSGVISLVVIMILVVVGLLPAYRSQRGAVLMAMLPAIPPVLLVTAIVSTGGQYPPIHDITTDTENPPMFDAALALRGDESNPVNIKPDVIETQQRFYPEVKTIATDMSPIEAMERAVSVAESLGWEVYNTDNTNGHIEATYTSFWFGFVDDIVIRVGIDAQGQTIVDLRSVSRVGRSDLGANAARIQAFSKQF